MKEEILEYFKDINFAYNDCTRFDTLKRMIGELEQEPKEITLEDVKEYCEKRCLTIVTNKLFHELTHHQEPILDKIRAEIMSKDGLEEALEIIDKYKDKAKMQ